MSWLIRQRVVVWGTLAALLALMSVAGLAPAADKPAPAGGSDDTAIRATAEAFVKAFNRGDAKAVAALWTPGGTLIDDDGEMYKGRQAIEDAYVAFFKAQPGVHMEVDVESIDFATPGVAVEDGLATVLGTRGAPPSGSRYTAVHVLQDGKWLMASVRESRVEVPSNYAKLQGFEWLVGQWETKSDGAVARSEVRWIANKSFLQRQYAVRKGGLTISSGMQILGWDPQSGQVKSWSFDSTGGHGVGYWTATPDGWQIESSGVSADGAPTASRDFLVRVAGDANVFGWHSVNRKAGDTILPDTPEIVFDRVAAKP